MRASRRAWLWLWIASSIFATPVMADDEAPYCRKVRARASEDSALLLWPRLVAEGVRYPSTDTATVGPTIGHGIQPRVGLSHSPLEAYRAFRLGRAARADCRAHEAADHLEDFATHAMSRATLEAARAQSRYLEERRVDWQALVRVAERRLSSGMITALELLDLRRRVGALDRKLHQARSEVARLERRPAQRSSLTLSALEREFTTRSMESEREAAHIRRLDPFQFKLSGGVIPATGEPLAWYGLAELSFSLGTFARYKATRRYLDARQDELAQSVTEPLARLSEVRGDLTSRLTAAREELGVIERELLAIRATREAIERARTSRSQAALAVLVADEILTEADRVYLSALVTHLSVLLKEPSA